MGVQPFKAQPLVGIIVCVPFIFFVWCVRRRFFFLSFSLCQALGKPKPLVGFGVPLVTLRLGHALRLQPVLPLPLLHQGPAPAPVFFFARAGLSSVFGSRGGVSVRSVFWSGVLVGPGCLLVVLLHSCISSCIRATAMPVFRTQWRLTPFPPLIGSSWVTRLLLGVDLGTVRSAAVRGCGRHCDPTNS